MYKVSLPFEELTPQYYYINEMWNSICFRDILAAELFPNAKELTESCAAFNAVRRYCPFKLDDPNVTLVSIGDGKTPRTAGLFAFRTKWNCISIDPLLAGYTPKTEIERLQIIPSKVEDLVASDYEQLVVVGVHSHAPMDIALSKFRYKQLFFVAIPCCNRETFPYIPCRSYLDKGIWSPENRVLIWSFDDTIDENTFAEDIITP